MPRRNLQWYDTLPNSLQTSRIRRCVRNFTREETEPFRLFGTLQTEKKDGVAPFTYKERLFVAVFREDFVVAIEDRHLDIKPLIDLWDCKPIKYRELPFAEDFEHYVNDV